MKHLKKRSVACLIAAIVVVVFGLFGMYRSASAQAKTVKSTFTDGNYCITFQLQSRCANASSMYTLGVTALGSGDESAEAMRTARADLYGAIAAGAEPSELYQLNLALQEAVELYYAHLGNASALAEDKRSALDEDYKNFKSAQRVIEADSYNSSVWDYQDRVLATFPLTVFRAILPISEPELFA